MNIYLKKIMDFFAMLFTCWALVFISLPELFRHGGSKHKIWWTLQSDMCLVEKKLEKKIDKW